MVFQYPETQLFEETVYNDIAFGPKNIGLSDIDEKIKKATDLLEIQEEILIKSPFDISGGEQRRVAIAGVMAMEPEILILDEPTAGLDPASKNSILNMIKNYQKQDEERTIVIVSHDINVIAEFANKVLILDKGSIVKYDRVENVFSDIDSLNRLNIAIPEVTKIFCELKKRGFGVNTNIYTIQQAKKEILSLM